MTPSNPVANGHSNGGSQVAPDDVNPALRSKVVEILANTANGCLSELGYYPGMPQRMQELERQNLQWQSENVKLFQDNRSLSQALSANDERSKNAISSLEVKIQGLLNEKSSLIQQNEMLKAKQPPALYQQLLSEYQRLSVHYQAACAEITQLRAYIHRITEGRYALQQPLPSNSGSPSAISSPTSATSFLPVVGSQTRQHLAQFIATQASNMSLPQSPIGQTPVVPAPQAQPVEQAAPVVHQPQRQLTDSAASVVSQTYKAEERVKEALSIISDWRRQSTTQARPAASASPSLGTMNHPHPFPPPNRSASLPVHVVSPSLAQNTNTPSSAPSPDALQTVLTLPGPLTNVSQLQEHLRTEEVMPESIVIPTAEVPTGVKSPSLVDTTGRAHSNPVTESSSISQTSSTSPSGLADVPTMNSGMKRMSAGFDTEHTSKRSRIEGQVGVEDAQEESDEDIVEVGPDGLRLAEDCVSAMIDDDDEVAGLQHCQLCRARYEMGFSKDPPVPFQNATIEQLVLHCSSEHEDAWNTLRTSL